MSITLRPTTQADESDCGRIVFEAFACIARRHNFPLDFPSVEVATGLSHWILNHAQFFGMAADEDGKPLAFNFLDQRNPIGGVGPMVVDPAHQGKGLGRQLMRAIVARGESMRGIRLVQDAFNTTSMSLYASLGFETREPLALMMGKLRSSSSKETRVRPMTERDLDPCAALCVRTHGFDRTAELRDGITGGMTRPHVLERAGRIVAYASAPWFWFLNHGIAQGDGDMRDLLLGASAASDEPLALLLPTRQAGLFRWLLAEGLRVVKPMSLMTTGSYQEPVSPWWPSVLY